MLADSGDLEDAAIEFDDLARDGFAGLPDNFWAPLALRHLAEVCAELGDEARAALLRPFVLPYAGQILLGGNGTSIEGAADRSLGVLALTLGDVDEAVDRLVAGAAIEDRMGFRVLSTRTRFWVARALIAQCKRDEATALLVDVEVASRELGLAGLAARAATLRAAEC